MQRFLVCADHPDVLDAGVVSFDRQDRVVRGFVRLHRRRTLQFIRKWVLPSAKTIGCVTRGELKEMQGARCDTPWCGMVHRRMHDIRAKASRR